MKKFIVPLSCLVVAATGCIHTGRTPDWNPAEDVPPGTRVRVTLQDAQDAERRSTFVVDPRRNVVVERLDGRRAHAHTGPEASSEAETKAASGTSGPSVSGGQVLVTMVVTCQGAQASENGCVVLAIDPKHETSGDPNPIVEERERIARTERFVKQLAAGTLEAAHRNGLQVHLPAIRREAR
ncbi:putative lipoprotein [Myxococcus hansupus]|uniref:Putative lipoprotein n=1 Tax=Pseudomyxococcus hansupus TaxID=1297742 RepID=A0A0H4WT83_9BACT|nr:hypothetical protein [Myxococcus hansupus]AKQ64530.1 putative lipoprotein [Myxococcus hansupus]